LDPVSHAVSQTMQEARQAGGTEQGGSLPPLSSTQAATGQNGHVDDGRRAVPSQVVTIPTGGVSWGKKTSWIDMPDEYAGMKIRIWVNYPADFDVQIQSRNNDIIRATLKQIFLEHNGWTDPEEVAKAAAEGRTPVPLPPPTTDEFWNGIPNELAGALMLLVNRETLKLPNLLLKQNRSLMSGQ
jgi:hypothetical protein